MDLEINEHRALDELQSALQKMEETQNTVTLNEFMEYQALFLKETADKMERDQIVALSNRFIRRFNPYRPIEVTDHNGHLIFRVPQLFIPIKDISEEYNEMVNKFHSDGTSSIPKYSSEATYGLLVAIINSQKDIDNTQYKTYGEYIQALSHQYKQDVAFFEQLKTGETKTPSDTPKVEEKPIDTIPGLSWD